MKTSIVLLLGVGVVFAVASLLVLKQSPVDEPPVAIAIPASNPEPLVALTPPPPDPLLEPSPVVVAAPPAPQEPPEDTLLSSPAPTKPKPARASAPAAQGGGGKEPAKDPLAREALALVGLDPAAEAYWGAAINDPSLSAHERQDLIEDLNEDGLSDPKNPAPDDLPIILQRIRLIEADGPYAMDQVNADAFQEAYKDLVNLAERALGGGEPVR